MRIVKLKMLLTIALLALTTGMMGQTVRSWDFTQWSDETVTNLKADTENWSDDEKGNGATVTNGNCLWLVGSGDATNGLLLTANGTEIAETKDLLFTQSASRALAIAVNYPSTSLGTYHGSSYLWLGNSAQNYFVISDVKPGSTIKMGVESHKPSDARGVKLYLGWGNSGTELKDAEGNTVEPPTAYTEQTWVMPEGLISTSDITVYNTNGCHLYFIEVTEPEAEVATETASVIWSFNSETDYATAYTATPENSFSLVNVDLGVLTTQGTGTGQAVDGNGNAVTFLKLNSSTGGSDVCKWQVKPAAGLTFTPTKVSMYIQRFGTDAQNGVTVSASLADGTSVTLGNYTAPRNNKAQADDKYGSNSNYTNKVEIELTAEQQLQLTTSEILTLSATVGVGTGKQGGFSDVQIHGVLTGEAVAVNKYTLQTALSLEGAGILSKSPNADEYEEGTEVTLTATENFGYDFVNWTNAAGEVVSTDAQFKYTVTADETLTANFKQVNTYELAMAIEGGANDYMISYNPEPTMVDGKQMYEEGTVVGIVASSNAILTFKNWSTGETSTSFSVTMNADKSYTAYYGAGDYIIGWDFMKKGGENRPADFASTVDNETATFYLINESGATASWLDKSNEAAGGYESFEGAAVNWGKLGEYWYQFDFNASEFTDIRVDAEMMYNFNAYTTIKVQYSVDGTTWTDAGTLTMSKVKTEYPVSVELGEDANNAEKVYVRYYPDKTAGTDGTTSDLDGTTITNVFVYGKQAAVDDGKAPTLTSSIPATGATGASATGKIVLNFHEKVTLADDAVATIGTKEVTGEVSGTSITFAYTGLDYNTKYTFTLPANSVEDLTGNACASDITIEFTTIAPPTVTKAEYDAVVTNAEEFLAALNEADGSTRFRIFLHDGTYDLGTACLTSVPGNVSLIGESMENTIIMNDPQAEGISKSATLCTGGENIYMQDLTIESADYDRLLNGGSSLGRCVALQENASKAVYKNVRLLSNQDTYYTRATERTYWEGGMIAGTVDYICGGGDIFFNGVTLYNNKRGSGDCITAPATSTDWGYVFSNCTIDGADEQNGSYSLGRPWQGSPRAVYINTTMKIIPSAEGWSNMGTVPGLFAEYNSHTASGAAVDCSKRKTTYTYVVDNNTVSETVTYNPVLTDAEAAKFTIENVLGGDDSWQPQLLTEQAQTPVVTVENGVLTWNASDYVLLYAICMNGKVIDFTTENSWTIPATTDDAYYSVRAANEMGGLGEASVALNANGEEAAVSTWKNIAINLATSDFLEESEKDTENRVTVSLGLVVGEDGTLTRVAADNASADIVLDGKYWNDHGWNGFKATVPVEGSVKIGVGSCNYAGQTVTVKNANGDVVTSFAVEKLGDCWKNKQSDDYVAYGYYYGKATTLTIEYSSYIPYISIEAIDENVLVINDTETECDDFSPVYESYDRVVYNRELNTGYTYGLICLPFAPDAESLNHFQFYTLSSVANDAVTFVEEEAPVANTPYLYSIKEGATRTSTITGGETTVSTEVNNTTVGTWTLVGSLKNETIDCSADATVNNYIFNPAQNTLHRVKTTLTVYPYTAYLSNNVASTQNNLSQMRVFIGTPTGIKEISRDQIEGFGDKAGMFDLQGRALSNPVKGQIYIENGEKKIKN